MNKQSLIGKWKLVSWTNKAHDKIYYPFGYNPQGWAEFTGDKFISYSKKDNSNIDHNNKLATPFYQDDLSEFSATGLYELKNDEIVIQYQETSIADLQSGKFVRKVWFDNHRTMVISGEKAIGDELCSVSATYVKI